MWIAAIVQLDMHAPYVDQWPRRKNSPGQRPIGVLDLQLRSSPVLKRSSLLCEWAPPGPSGGKAGSKLSRQMIPSLRVAHGDCIFSMDSLDAFTIHP